MKKMTIITAFCLLFITALSYSQQYSFIPKGLKLLSMKELMSKPPPTNIDLVYFEDGTKTTFKEAMAKFNAGGYIPHVFVNDKGAYKILVMVKGEMPKMTGGNLDEIKDLTGQQAKPFSVSDINENKFSLSKLKGKIIVINFWFINCKPCIAEMPALNKLVKEYKNIEDVVFLGFALDDKTALNNFLMNKSFDYKIIPNTENLSKLYEISGYPTHIIIDKKSKITYFGLGGGPTIIDGLKKSIENHLK